MRIRIELKSDTCFGSGEIYNSFIDSDVCYDEYGLPYLPAKRLKGCLRECAKELCDWGEKISLEEIFGKAGGQSSRLMISNGKLENYEEYRAAIQKEKNRMLVHPQRVLDLFSYTRTQTRIDEKTGAAKDTSLRVTRVLKRGLVFLADIEIEEYYVQDLEKCCKVLRHMGLNRTRGMGEVKVSLEKNIQNPDDTVGQEEKNTAEGKENKCEKLEYRLYLKSPLLCKSIAGGQTKTADYIEGAKILGLVAQCAGKEFLNLMDKGELICSNAYIAHKKENQEYVRCLPVWESLGKVKGAEEQGRERAAKQKKEKKERIQSVGNKYWYPSDNANELYLRSVETNVRYHHSRPDDKGAGHVLEEGDDSQLYQIESIGQGQSFVGFLLGEQEQIQEIYQYFKNKDTFRMGYNRSAEYGEVKIMDLKQQTKQAKTPCMETRFLIKCNAPVLLYDHNGMYSTDVKDMIAKIEEILGISGAIHVEKTFLKFVELGGYNVTWDTKKPTLLAFEKGSTILCSTDSPVDISRLDGCFIGERVQEGYGEMSAVPVPKSYEWNLKETEEIEEDAKGITLQSCGKQLIFDLKKRQSRIDTERAVVAAAKEVMENIAGNDSAPAVVNQLFLLYQQIQRDSGKNHIKSTCDLEKELKSRAKAFFTGETETEKKKYGRKDQKKRTKKAEKKWRAAECVLNGSQIDKCRKKIKEDYWNTQEQLSDDLQREMTSWYLETYLQELKYQIRKQKKEGEGQHERNDKDE